MTSTSSSALPQHRFRLLLIALLVAAAGALALLFVLAKNNEIVEKGQLLAYTGAHVYKVRFLDSFTVYVEAENKPSEDDVNAYVLVGIAFLCLCFATLLARFSRDLTSQPFWFFVLTCLGANYLAADEHMGIHETIGHNLQFLRQLPTVERPDDVIVALYAVLAVVYCWIFRRVLTASARVFLLVFAAVVLVGFAAATDLWHTSAEEILEIGSSGCLIAAVLLLGLEHLDKAVAARYATADPARDERPLLAYLTTRFPKPTETFILYELLALQELGHRIEMFAYVREKGKVLHPGAEAIVAGGHFPRLFSLPVLEAQLYWLAHRPGVYLATWLRVLAGNLPSRKFFFRALVATPLAAHFAREMQERDVRHVHAHWATHSALGAWVIGRLTGIPYSFTAHAHDIYVDRTMLEPKIAGAKFVATISGYNKKLLEGSYGDTAKGKVHVIHCGTDTSVFKAPEKPLAEVKEALGTFSILCIGALEAKKGQTYLIEACAKLRERGLDFRCRFVGGGPSRPELEAQIASSDLGGRVELLGQQPRNRVAELLGESDVMVLPSILMEDGKMEGIPVVLMESLASEVAAVSTKISGIPELVIDGETGLLVEERDPEGLAEALVRLAADPELRRRLGKAGREKVLKEFDLKGNARALHDLLTEGWDPADLPAADLPATVTATEP